MCLGYINYMVQTCEEKTYRHFGFQQMWHEQLLQPSKLDSTAKTEVCLLDNSGGIFSKVYFLVSPTQGNLYIATYLWKDFRKTDLLRYNSLTI